jgi:hypothetical protein
MSALSLTLTGCTVSAAQVAADGKTINAALLAVAALEDANNARVAADIRMAAAAILVATANWQTGTPTDAIFSALEGAALAISGIDPNSKLGLLAAIAYVAIVTLRGLLPAPSPTLVARTSSKPNRYANTSATIPHRFGRSPEGDFKAKWNQTAKENNLMSAILP